MNRHKSREGGGFSERHGCAQSPMAFTKEIVLQGFRLSDVFLESA